MAPEPGSPDEWRKIITMFLREHLDRSGADGFVVGLSGGIDSAVTAALCVEAVGADKVLGLCLPHAESDPDDRRLGLQVAQALGIEVETVEITGIIDALVAQMPDAPFGVVANAKARARMMVLYARAQALGRLVCGTGNKSELLVGYFTKWGDGGVDLEPIGDLWKTQVWQLARAMGLPPEVIDRPPTAGLQPGQSDEDELGMPYDALDAILKCIELNAGPEETVRRTGLPLEQVKRAWDLVRRSEHKRHLPLVPKLGARTVGIDWRRPVHWDA